MFSGSINLSKIGKPIILCALLLVVTICTGCALFEASSGFFEDVLEDVIIETETYPVSGEVKKLDIEIGACSLEILRGNTFRVENNYKYLSYELKDDCITIRETKQFIRNNSSDISVKVWIPDNVVFDKADISTGAGQVRIEYLKTGEINVKLGAGNVEFNDVVVSDKTTISGGVGKLQIENSTMNNFKFEMGMGSFEFEGYMLGNSKIDCGVGSTNIILLGSESDYSVKIETGIGNYSINAAKNGDYYGTGENFIEIKGGVGDITVDYKAQ